MTRRRRRRRRWDARNSFDAAVAKRHQHVSTRFRSLWRSGRRLNRRRQIQWLALIGAAAVLTMGLPDLLHHLVGRAATVPAGQEVGTRNPGLSSSRPIVNEESAAEILRNLKGFQNNFYDKVDQLYAGRWTRDPGWHAIVDGLPSRVSDGSWSCILNEPESDTLIFADTNQDLSTFRRGDHVLVTGRIKRVSSLGSVTLEEASVSRTDP